ncbi:MAG: trypsin-like peptidase domain-containing protein [Defluviitaleaceae bacterium]|nr:trypsin-like peptidase domain-containing protein [Defluviitaleaceae bacterium]
MYDLIHIPVTPPPSVKKTKPLVITMIIAVSAAFLMLGSGYAGARIAQSQFFSFSDDASTVTEYSSDIAANSIELLSSNLYDSGLSLPDLFEITNPAVVAISTQITGHNIFGQPISHPSAGSGFLVSHDGYIVTNDHVIENATSITVLMYNGIELPATVVGRAPASDLAVIKVEGVYLPFLSFGDSDSVRVGEQVAAIGNPLGQLANSMTVGYISAISRDINIDGVSINKLQTDAAVNRGNSGGPLINLHGEVIGIVSAKSTGVDVEGLGFAIPSSYAKTIVNQLIESGFVSGRAILGVQVSIYEDSHEVLIASVNRGGAADRAGVLPGDIIVAANGTIISSFAELREVLDSASPREEMELLIRRGNVEINVIVTLDEDRPMGV